MLGLVARLLVALEGREQVDAYLAGDTIQCLDCGRWFRGLGRHLRVAHNISSMDYRAKHGLPAMAPLVGRSTRETLSEQMRQMIADGTLNHTHLPQAVAAATEARRTERQPWERQEQSARAARIPHTCIPPGGKRADGRDAERAREYQRARRSRLKEAT